MAEFKARLAVLTVDSEITAAKRDLRYWQTREITAELAPDPSGETVEIGTQVCFLINGKQRSLSIVGHDEADLAGGLVSYSAPLSRALMGAKAGDFLAFAGVDDAIEVLSVAVISGWLSPCGA